MKIAIGIPTYNRDDVLIKTVEQAFNQSRPADEIIVIDQTKDHAPSVAAKLAEWINSKRIIYVFQEDPSLPAARNYALSITNCGVMIFIDDDVELPNNFVQMHESNYLADSSVQAVAGGVDQRLGWPKKNRPSSWSKVLDYRYFDLGSSVRVENIASFIGCNHSILVSKAIQLGGYDERFKGVALREDSDMAMRIYFSGGRIVFDPNARLFHLAIPTGGCRRKNPLDIGAARSNIFFGIKHIKKLKLNFFFEFGHAIRLGLLTKTNVMNPFYFILCFLKFVFYLIQSPIILLTTKNGKRF